MEELTNVPADGQVVRLSAAEAIRSPKARGSRRGERSTLCDVRLPKNKPCTLKRHFIGCLRQVIGLAEKLAAKDPDRFVWIKEKGFLKYARKRKSGMYSVRAVRYSVDVAKQIGVLVPTQKTKNGVFRTGFVVADHKVVSTTHGNRCILNLDVRSDSGFGSTQSAAQNTPSAATSASAHGASAVPSASEDDAECLSDFQPECPAVMGQDVEGEILRNATPVNGTQNFKQESSSEPSQPSQVNPYSPVKQNPARQNKTASAKSQNDNDVFLTDYDREPHLYAKTNDKTIGEHFNFSDWRLEAVINAISDGEFDTKYLAGYKDVSDLLGCCEQSIQELAHEPFLGRVSCARVMGKAMEILRRDYGQNVPKGWVPVLKRLRGSASASGEAVQSQNDSGVSVPIHESLSDNYYSLSLEDEREKRESWLRGVCNVEELISGGPSVIRWARATISKELDALPEVKSSVFWCAARRGLFPDHVTSGIPFVEDVIFDLTLRGTAIPACIRELQDTLIDCALRNKLRSCRSQAGLNLTSPRQPSIRLIDAHSGEIYHLDRDVYEHRKQKQQDPENIFGLYSAFFGADSEASDELSKQSEVRRLFVEAAKEQGGVPTCYQDALKFMQLVAQRCKLEGTMLPDPALRLQKRLEEINERFPDEVKVLSDRNALLEESKRRGEK